MRKLGIFDVIDTVEDIVEEFGPDHANPNIGCFCLYTMVDGSHCLIGQTLDDLEMPYPQSEVLGNAHSLLGMASIYGLHLHLTADALEFMGDLQWHADSGDTWKQAFKKVRESWEVQ